MKPLDYHPAIDACLKMKLIDGYIVMRSSQFYVPGIEPEDLAQELRIKIWKVIPKFNPEFASFKTWALVVINNYLRDLYRKQTGKWTDCLNSAYGLNYYNESMNVRDEMPDDLDALIDICMEYRLDLEDLL